MTRRIRSTGVLLLLFLAENSAGAQTQPRSTEPSPDAIRVSDEARERGIQFMKEERYADALHAFTEAHKLAPAPRTAAQKGLAEQAMHLWLPAEAHINLALEHADDPWIKKNRVFLEEAVRDIGAHIGALSLDFAKPVDGIRLTAAGEWIPWSAPRPVRLPEGEIVLEIRAEGYSPWRRTVVVRAGTMLRIPVDLVAASPAPPAPMTSLTTVVTPTANSGKLPSWLVVAMAVAGTAAVGYGGYLLSVDGDSTCGSATSCSTVRRTRVPGMLLVGAGAVLGTGSFVVATWHAHEVDRAAVLVGMGRVAVRF